MDNKKVMIAAHGNSIRALVKYLDEVPDDEITGLNIPTGFPLVYELDDSLHPVRHYYLGDEEEIRHATESVADQAATTGENAPCINGTGNYHDRYIQGLRHPGIVSRLNWTKNLPKRSDRRLPAS